MGERVRHEKLGVGEVKKEWGCFRACHSCTALLFEDQEQCECGGFADTINGSGIYDIYFFKDNKIHSINQQWLEPAP
jgi:hypothetical protein